MGQRGAFVVASRRSEAPREGRAVRRAAAKAGVDDAALAELAATIDADKKEGADAVDALIAKVPVRGGSGVRLRKALLEKDGSAGAADRAAGRGGRAGRGRGKGKKAPPPRAESRETEEEEG